MAATPDGSDPAVAETALRPLVDLAGSIAGRRSEHGGQVLAALRTCPASRERRHHVLFGAAEGLGAEIRCSAAVGRSPASVGPRSSASATRLRRCPSSRRPLAGAGAGPATGSSVVALTGIVVCPWIVALHPDRRPHRAVAVAGTRRSPPGHRHRGARRRKRHSRRVASAEVAGVARRRLLLSGRQPSASQASTRPAAAAGLSVLRAEVAERNVGLTSRIFTTPRRSGAGSSGTQLDHERADDAAKQGEDDRHDDEAQLRLARQRIPVSPDAADHVD